MKRIILFALAIISAVSIDAQNITGIWKGMLQTGNIKLNLVFNINTDAQGKSICTFDSPDQGAKGIPTKLDFISKDSISVSISQINFNYSGKLSNNIIKGFVKQNGISLPVDLTPGKITYDRPQNPSLPLPYSTEEVCFENKAASAKLYGTLSYPVGYKKGKKVPVVIMVSGSGQQNRDEEIF